MTMQLPKPIAAYFEADSRDRTSISDRFTDDAIVKDEGQTYVGRAAIHDWKVNAARKYSYTIAPFAIDTVDGKAVVTAKVTGNFPGSPVDLRYVFGVDGDKIASLEIKL
jgi:hypothetical protein